MCLFIHFKLSSFNHIKVKMMCAVNLFARLEWLEEICAGKGTATCSSSKT